MHDRTRIRALPQFRDRHHILEDKVFDMIGKICSIRASFGAASTSARKWTTGASRGSLHAFAGKFSAVEEERRQIIARYAAGELTAEAYIAANRALDERQERLTGKKAQLIAAMRFPTTRTCERQHSAILRNSNARLQACIDFDTKRQFLMDHVAASDLQPLQDHGNGFRAGPTTVRRNHLEVSDRGRDQQMGSPRERIANE